MEKPLEPLCTPMRQGGIGAGSDAAGQDTLSAEPVHGTAHSDTTDPQCPSQASLSRKTSIERQAPVEHQPPQSIRETPVGDVFRADGSPVSEVTQQTFRAHDGGHEAIITQVAIDNKAA